jgi:hypothetical protein
VFGYVRPHVPDLRVREYDDYRALYCGLCRAMKRATGTLSSFSLRYDTVFLLMVRLLYSDEEITYVHRRCAAHPFRRHREARVTKSFLDAARLSAVLVAGKVRDDLSDETGLRRLRANAASPFTRHWERRARLPDLSERTRRLLSDLRQTETEETPSVDIPAELSGEILGHIFAEGMEEDRELLFTVGKLLGKLVYKKDAYLDREEDRRRGRYNPYNLVYPDGMTKEEEADFRTAFRIELSLLEEEMQKLPLDRRPTLKPILENILYLGLDRFPTKKGTKDEGSL